MTTRQTIKRFCEPYKASKFYTALMLIRMIYTIWYSLFSVKYFQIAVQAIEQWSYAQLKLYSIWFMIYTVFIYVMKLPEKKRIMTAIKEYSVYIDVLYLKKFLQASNQHTEQLWVGRVQSIFKNWVLSWAWLMIETVSDYGRTFLLLIASIIYIWTINI